MAARTRRARSEAARKAWETRRENERQAKASAAARKAWITRRQRMSDE
jgi:hypothetical protein